MAKVRAALSADRSVYTMRSASWGETEPVSKIPSRLAMYRKLAARKDGKFAHIYAPSIKALERLAGILKSQVENTCNTL